MPELAEVFYYSKKWDQAIGQKIVDIKTNPHSRVYRDTVPKYLMALRDSKYLGSITHGKQILCQFTNDNWLWVQLGMTGSIKTSLLSNKIDKHDHLVLKTKNEFLLYYDPRMFGRIRYFNSKTPPVEWQSLPPEIKSRQFTVRYLEKILDKKSKTLIKPLLLDQAYFPGIGNWMADEILWKSKINPNNRAKSIENTSTLHKSIKDISRYAIKTIGSNWDDPPKSWLFQHRWKDNQKCPYCSSPLLRQKIQARTSCWCPKCQP